VQQGLLEIARDEIFGQVARSERRIELASPFLSSDVAKGLIHQARVGRSTERRFLTALVERSVLAGVLDPAGLAALLEAGWQVASIPNLHAKVTVIDGVWGLVGSGNLTTAGLGGRGRTSGNIELGVVLNRRQVREARRVFERWWSVAHLVTVDTLRPFLELERQRSGSDAGRRVGRPIPVSAGRTLERLGRPRSKSGQAWIKAMYHDPRRHTPGWWRRRKWINDRHTESGARIHRMPRYQPGDLVALYLVEPGVVAALYQVTGTPEFRPDLVAAEDAVDSKKYGWVTPVDVLASLDIAQAPRLRDDFGIDGRSLQNGRKRIDDRALWRRIEKRFAT
jgi:hypothetical protein